MTTNAAICQWRNGSAGRVKTMEVGITQVAATTACSYGLGVPAALAGTPVDVVFQRDDPLDPASLVISSITWTTAPTAPTVYKRRYNSPAVAGVGVIWVFPRGYVMAISSAHVIHGITTMTANDISITVDE